MAGGQEADERQLAIMVNGEPCRARSTTLAALLDELGYGDQKVATALNETFVAARLRSETRLSPGDAVEIVAPRQGG